MRGHFAEATGGRIAFTAVDSTREDGASCGAGRQPER
jgi:hypothetical protein